MSLFSENKIIFLFAFLVGLIVILPQIVFIYNLGSDYHGVYMMGSDAETHYLARMREFYDGNGIGNPFIYEYKDNVPTSFFSLSEPILAFPGYLLGVSVSNISLFYKFFIPFIAFIFIYFLFLSILGDKWWSIAGSLFIIFGHSFLNAPHIIDFLSWNKVYNGFVAYARPINPAFSSLLFYSYLYNLFKVFNTEEKKYFYYLWIIFSFSFYVYLYSFTFIFALNFVFIFVFYFLKEKDKLKNLFYVSVFGCVAGIPALLSILSLVRHPLYKDFAEIVGVESSRGMIFSSAWIFVSVLFSWNFIKKERQNTDYYILGLLFTSFLVLNQQVVTGIMLQEGHYHWYFNTPIFIISLFWLLWKNFGSLKKGFTYAFLFFVCFVSLVNAYFYQSASYDFWYDKVSKEQRYSYVFDWLNKNTRKEDVVFANLGISKYISVYTHNNVVWEDHASYYLLSRERREFTQENILKNFNEEYLKRYRIDYFIKDNLSDNYLSFRDADFLSKVDEFDNFEIYVYKN